MEAHHLRLELLDDLAGGLVEGRAVGAGYGRIRFNAELRVVVPKPRLPAGFPAGVRLRRRMREEVEVDRIARSLPDDAHCGADLLRGGERAGITAEPACLRDGDPELRRAGSGHGSQKNRVLDAEQLGDPAVWPHGRSSDFALIQPARAAASAFFSDFISSNLPVTSRI